VGIDDRALSRVRLAEDRRGEGASGKVRARASVYCDAVCVQWALAGAAPVLPGGSPGKGASWPGMLVGDAGLCRAPG
jgi:hypothetical protein